MAAATPTLPADSVLRLGEAYTDQDGKDFALASRRGRPQLVSMFYTSCPYICPLIIDSGQGVDAKLTPAERAKLRILLVSIDPRRRHAGRPAGDGRASASSIPRRWTLARTDEDGVRKIAAVLGVRYRALADGEFNHTSVIVLLDADGRILARTTRMGAVPEPEFLAKVHAALK